MRELAPDDWNAILARIGVVAEALDLTDSEISEALVNEAGLIAFARRYGQSLDWIILGDVRPMLCARRRAVSR